MNIIIRIDLSWWHDFWQHVDSWDMNDYFEWRWGTECILGSCIDDFAGTVHEPHDYPMPLWLERQLHFENIISVCVERVRYAFGEIWCRTFGHPNRCVEIEEGNAESPWVAWSCSCCGNGGHSCSCCGNGGHSWW